MESTSELCRRLERAVESQRYRRRLPVRTWLHEFIERFNRSDSQFEATGTSVQNQQAAEGRLLPRF